MHSKFSQEENLNKKRSKCPFFENYKTIIVFICFVHTWLTQLVFRTASDHPNTFPYPGCLSLHGSWSWENG